MADWSQLPKDLLDLVAKRLESPFYKLRFRSVCSSWRSSVSSRPRRRLAGRFPFLPNDGIISSTTTWGFHLSRRTIFLINPCSQTTPQNKNSWLIKMEEDLPGRMQLLNPLSRSQLKSLPLDFPKVMNLLNFQVIDLGHEYVLHYINFKPFASSSLGDVGSLYMEKVVFMCLGSETETDVFALLTIHVSGKLALFMSEDKRWSIINDMPSPYDDVVLFKDEFYAVDSNGRTVLVELSSNLSLVAEPVFGGDKKFLVESDGQLLLVDMYLSVDFGDDVDVFEDVDEVFDKFIRERTVRFKVFKLNWEGKRWVEVTSLGDRVLFLGDDCTFSALASDLSGCKGNCIFFRDNNFYMTGEEGDVNGVFRGRDIGVCDLDNGSIKPLVDYLEYSKLFWPPPDWVASTTSGCKTKLKNWACKVKVIVLVFWSVRVEFYAVDSNGRTVLVGLSSNVSLVAEPVFDGGDKKYLVESDGQLLMVDMYVDDDHDWLVWFKVFKLDLEGKSWVELKSLVDRVLFLGDDCTFSASALELSGCKGNCIFFSTNYFYGSVEEDGGNGVFRGRDIGVCDLDNGSVKPLADYLEYSKLFWPPPDWAVSTTSGIKVKAPGGSNKKRKLI